MRIFFKSLLSHVKYCIYNGAILLIPVAIISLFSCLQCAEIGDYVNYNFDYYTFWLYKGMEYPRNQLTIIPDGVWIFLNIYSLLYIGNYLNKSESFFFKYEIIKSRSRLCWIVSRYVTIVFMLLLYYFTEICVIFIFSSLAGNIYITSFRILQILIAYLGSLTIVSIFYMANSLFRNIFIAYLICSGMIVFTVYEKWHMYIGNMLMFLRENDVQLMITHSILCVITIVIALVISIVSYMKRDLL